MSEFPYQGYGGSYLRVNLTQGTIDRFPTPAHWVDEFLGGGGIGVRILWNEVPVAANPLGPENKLILSTGPLCGSPIPYSGRCQFIAKSPLTGLYGDANVGGFLGPELKFAGIDWIIFEGRSPKPVYLYINDDRVQLLSASQFWGMGTFQTDRMIRKNHMDPGLKVAAIGPAGENLVRFASIQCTHQRSAARGGMGAVMGSKNLKAIAVRGHQTLKFADNARLLDLSFDLQNKARSVERAPIVQHTLDPAIIDSLHGNYLKSEISCFNCPVTCDKVYLISQGEYEGTVSSSVEFETLISFGPRIGNTNLSAIIKANEICDDMGLDTISAGGAISFAVNLFERQFISPMDCDGLNLTRGDYRGMLEVLRRISCRQGFIGDLLAEGAARAARWLGQGTNNPSADSTQSHPASLVPPDESIAAVLQSNEGSSTANPRESILRHFKSDYLPDPINPLAVNFRPSYAKEEEDFGAVLDSSGNCKLGYLSLSDENHWRDQAEAISTATGMALSAGRLAEIGERISNLRRCYNALHGITSADDRMPYLVPEGYSLSDFINSPQRPVDEALAEYYHLREWDESTGLPLPKTLKRLGLGYALNRLHASLDPSLLQAQRDRHSWMTATS